MSLQFYILLLLLSLKTIASIAQNEDCDIDDKKSQKYYHEALNALNSQQYLSALQLLNHATDRSPEFAKAHYLKATIYSFQKDFKRAANSYEEVIAVCENYDPEVYFILGKLYYQWKAYDDCLVYLDKFIGSNVTDKAQMSEAKKMIEYAVFLDRIYKNPVPYNPRPIAGACTEYDEYLPILSPDNGLLFYTRRYEKKTRDAVIGKMWVEEFCMSKFDGSGFGEGIALSNPFNLGQNEGGASLSIDNKELYITVCRSPEGFGSCDLFHTEAIDNKWAPLTNLGEAINDSMWQSQVSLSADGKRLYFSSDAHGGLGGKDIYYSTRNEDGTWSGPVNMGAIINTAGDEKSPFIHQDNKTLYFSSNGHLGLGGFDIFISRRNMDDRWDPPSNIGYPINSSADDLGFFVSTDGKTGYFASNKLEGFGGWDIYSFPLYEEARPRKVLFVKGEVKDQHGQPVKGATLELTDMLTNKVQEVQIDSATGEFYLSELFENDQMMTVHKKGYFFDTKVIQQNDKAFAAPAKLDFNLQKFEIGSTFTMENILFETDQYNLRESSAMELDNLVRFLAFNDHVRIEISGHTDNVGNDDDNLRLSNNRARSVYQYLADKGVDKERMEFKGYGETMPVRSNNTASGRRFNRRTEIRIIESL